jgi:hypothetical protein
MKIFAGYNVFFFDKCELPFRDVDFLFHFVALTFEEGLGLLESVNVPHVGVDLGHLSLLNLLRGLQLVFLVL